MIFFPPPFQRKDGLALYPAERSLELFRILWFYTLFVSVLFQAAIYSSSLYFMPHLPWGERYLMRLGDAVDGPILAARVTAAITAFLLARGTVRHTFFYLFIFLNSLTIYFLSILDTYQHHYLYIIITLLAGLDPPERRWIRTRESILLFTSLVYFWTAIAKLTSPRFVMGLFMRDGLFLVYNVDRLLGHVLHYLGRETGEWVVLEFFRLASLGVIAVELVLAVHLLLRPFHWLNTFLMLSLHLTIGAMQLLLGNMVIGLFSLFMIAISVLTLPRTAWIERWLISFERKRDLIQQRSSSSCLLAALLLWRRRKRKTRIILSVLLHAERRRRLRRKGTATIVILLFVIHFLLALSYYVNPHRDPLDERFAWRMFSDLSVKSCEWELLALFENNTEVRKEAELLRPVLSIHSMMSRRVLRFMSHLVCLENPDVVMVSYTGICAVPVPSDELVYYSLTEEGGGTHTRATTNCSYV